METGLLLYHDGPAASAALVSMSYPSAQILHGAYLLDVNKLMVDPPTGTGLPGPCTSHIVNTNWEDNNSELYEIGRVMM